MSKENIHLENSSRVGASINDSAAQANRMWVRAVELLQKLLTHRRLPLLFAIVGVVFMLPSLKLGLIADDLQQRAVELRPDQLPPRMAETGNSSDCGKLSTVLFDLFGLDRNTQTVPLMKDYGALPWWIADNLRVSLCRPLAAFTHWIDYRLYPDSPAAMHAQNIAWFAAVVFMVTMVYRKLIGPGWAAGLAALLFLLDPGMYIPAAFVANRGYFLGIFFGMSCLCQHHRWRTTGSRIAMVLSMLFLALSLLGEESGASMFAFLLAYTLVLEAGNFRSRALALLPSVAVITVWWILYQLSGYGLKNLEFYTDPARDPLHFLCVWFPREMVLLGTQFNGVPPEILIAVKPSLYLAAVAIYGVFAVAALAIFFPWIRRDKTTAFWCVALIVAAIPESVLPPVSKNIGYVAIAGFGLVASVVGGVFSRNQPALESRTWKKLAVIACVLLLLVDGPVAVAKRIATVELSAVSFEWARRPPPDWPGLENENVVIINHPLPLESIYEAGYAAYYHCRLPKTVRVLAPACTGFNLQRTDDKTLVLESRGSNIFSCDDVGPIHFGYALTEVCRVFDRTPHYKKGDWYRFQGMAAEILALDDSRLPSRVAFHFDNSLNSPQYHWFSFDWRTRSMDEFKVPAIGQNVTLAGPGR